MRDLASTLPRSRPWHSLMKATCTDTSAERSGEYGGTQHRTRRIVKSRRLSAAAVHRTQSPTWVPDMDGLPGPTRAHLGASCGLRSDPTQICVTPCSFGPISVTWPRRLMAVVQQPIMSTIGTIVANPGCQVARTRRSEHAKLRAITALSCRSRCADHGEAEPSEGMSRWPWDRPEDATSPAYPIAAAGTDMARSS